MDNYNVMEDFKEYQKNQQELAEIVKEVSQVTNVLRMSKDKELLELSQKVKNDTFKIMVTGTFKNGKSTFINALLGEEILPAYAVPCTAVINEVKYGTEKRAILYFRNPLPDPLPDDLAEKAVAHMKKYKGKEIPPLEIPYDEIEDYVMIPMGANAEQTKMQSPYAKVELFYPLELLKNGVEIIDSPGLNEDETRTRVTLNYLSKVDAILYVLNANAICAGDEMEFVERDLLGNNFESVFFIVNRFDQIRKKEQPMIRKYAEMKLEQIYPNPELFCVSALNALDGRLEGDEALVQDSGMLPLERRLTEFLTKEKGKAKLVSPAKQMRQILSKEALQTVIPRERVLLGTSIVGVTKKYEETKPRLMMLTKEKEIRKEELDRKIQRSHRHFKNLSKQQTKTIMDSISAWVEEFEPTISLGIIPNKKKTEQAVEEISEYLKEKISECQQEWQKNVLIPEIEDQAREILKQVEEDISKIYKEIDSINLNLVGKEYDTNSVPFWQRVVGVAGGLAMGDVALAFSGGVNGIGKEFAKTIAFEVGAGFVLGLLGLFNPFTLIATIVAAFLMNIGKGSDRAMAKLKSKVAEEAYQNMLDNIETSAQGFADGIVEKFYKIAEQIIGSVTKEIDDIEKQLKAIMEEKQKGEAEEAKRKNELDKVEKVIHELNERLDTLVFKMMGA